MLDKRQIRTREALFNALNDILLIKDYKEINVTDIAKQAHIGRQTFYRHFESIDALMCDFFSEKIDINLDQIKNLESNNLNTEEWIFQATRFIFDEVAKNKNIARVILSGEAGSKAISQFKERYLKLWDILPADSQISIKIPNEYLEYVASYYTGAIITFLLNWVNNDCKIDSKTMTKLYLSLSFATEMKKD